MKLLAIVLPSFLGLSIWAKEADALPAFARRHQFQCVVCHTAVPKLNAVGRQYKENGFRFSDDDQVQGPWEWKDFYPIGIQGDVHYNADDRVKQGKFSVDELQLFFGGPIAYRTSMFIHHHIIEDNDPGPLHEAHLRVDRPAGLPAMFHVGRFEPWLANSPGKTLLTHGYLPYSFKVGLNPDTVGGSKLGLGSIWFFGPGFRLAADAYKDDKATSGLTRFFYRRDATEIGTFARYGKTDFTALVNLEGQEISRRVEDRFARIGIDFVHAVGTLVETYGAAYYAEDSRPTGTRDRGTVAAGFLQADLSPVSSVVFALRYEAIKILDTWENVEAVNAEISEVGEGTGTMAMVVPRRHTEAGPTGETTNLAQWGIFALHYYMSQNTHLAAEYRLNAKEPAESQSVAGAHFAF